MGMYKFSPATRSYARAMTDQVGEDYDTLVFGDARFSLSALIGRRHRTNS